MRAPCTDNPRVVSNPCWFAGLAKSNEPEQPLNVRLFRTPSPHLNALLTYLHLDKVSFDHVELHVALRNLSVVSVNAMWGEEDQTAR